MGLCSDSSTHFSTQTITNTGRERGESHWERWWKQVGRGKTEAGIVIFLSLQDFTQMRMQLSALWIQCGSAICLCGCCISLKQSFTFDLQTSATALATATRAPKGFIKEVETTINQTKHNILSKSPPVRSLISIAVLKNQRNMEHKEAVSGVAIDSAWRVHGIIWFPLWLVCRWRWEGKNGDRQAIGPGRIFTPR